MSKVLIVANGEWPELFHFKDQIKEYETIVALDGAANRLFGINIIPHVILGDLDSVSPTVLKQCKAEHSKIVNVPNQERSDISKGLQWVHQTYQESKVYIVGVEIGRYDHHLAAYSALFECKSSATILLNGWEAHRVSTTPSSFKSKQGEIVSLIPFGTVTGVNIEGCRYPLESDSLTTGTRGISNIAIESTITVSVESGDLLLLIER